MSCLFQVCSSFILLCWIMETAQSTPLLQGFSVQKEFEVKLHPFQYKPLTIFKEKWSPFGTFGIRKGIQKRDVSPPAIMYPAPVFEQVDEGKPIDEREGNIEASPTAISPGPELLKPLSSNLIRIPLMESFNPPTEGLYTNINRNLPANNIPETSGRPVIEELYGELPPRPVGPVPEAAASIPPQSVSPVPIQPVSPVSIQPVNPMPIQPVSPVFIPPATPIRLQPVGSFPVQPVSSILEQPTSLIPGQGELPVSQEVVPIITPPPLSTLAPNVLLSEIPPTDGPLVRGSKLALYYGNVFLQWISQFITNARLRISQLKLPSSPPAVLLNN